MSLAGRIFTLTRNENGSTTETCRSCKWSFTYRGIAHPTQRAEKLAHVCTTRPSQGA